MTDSKIGLGSLWFFLAAAAFAPQEVVAQTAIPPSAPDFAINAAQSDHYEILAGRVALAQSQNPRIREFAQHMIEEHTRTTDALRQATATSGLPPPLPAMSSDQSVLLAALQSLRGADFDRTYIRQQVLAHSLALAVDRSYASAGTDPNLCKVAQSSVPAIQEHLKVAEQIRDALGGS